MIPSEAGKSLLPAGGNLELCVVSSSGEATCLPAFGEPGSDSLRPLKTLTAMQDLLTGLRVELRKRDAPTALATWARVASPTPQVLCKGLAVSLTDGKETLGQVSVFIESPPTAVLKTSTDCVRMRVGRLFPGDVVAGPRRTRSGRGSGNRTRISRRAA